MNNCVKSANLHEVGDLRYENIILDKCENDEVTVKVKSCGICGSDIDRVYNKGTYTFPTVIGHEFSGEIVFDSNDELNKKRVAVFPLLPCFKCDNCLKKNYATCKSYDYYGSRRNGGMSEYINVKRWNVLALPENLSYDEGAMCEPVSVARHAVLKLKIKNGENVFISGAGPIGQIAGMWAKIFGAKQVFYIDIDKRKIEFVKHLGFEEYSEDVTVDCALEGTGNGNALKKCIEAVKSGGNAVLMGNPSGDVNISRDAYWQILRKELQIFGTWNSSFNDIENDWKESLKAMSEGRIDIKPLITHKFPLQECNKAFEMMKNKTDFYNKVMLNMNEEV